MKKQSKGREGARLRRRIHASQRTALLARSILKRALKPEIIDGNEVDETGSEQIERADRAMVTVMAHLARIVDPDALSQEQAEQTVERMEQSDGLLDNAMRRKWDEDTVYGVGGLVVTLRQLVMALQQYHDLDRCTCVEVLGERCLFCSTGEALNMGERWLALLDTESPRLPQDDTTWERLWYFENRDLVHLVTEVQQEAFVYGQYLDRNVGEGATLLNNAASSSEIENLVQRVLAPFVWRLKLAGGAESVMPFLKPYIVHWLLKGQQQGRSSFALSDLERQVQLQVLNADASDLNWGTTQSVVEVSTLLPNLLVHILSNPTFTDLSWSSGDTRYRLSHVISPPTPLVPERSEEVS